MTRPIPDKAEVALEYPDKFYVGTFDRTSRFDAHLDATGLSLVLERPGEENVRKSIHMHLNYDLFAQILQDLAATAAAMSPDDMTHRARFLERKCERTANQAYTEDDELLDARLAGGGAGH